MNLKKVLFSVICVLLLVLVNSYATSCECYNESDARAQCYSHEEYDSTEVNSGECWGTSCKANVSVTCLDKDENNDRYIVKNRIIWGDSCRDCDSSGGGGGDDNWIHPPLFP